MRTVLRCWWNFFSYTRNQRNRWLNWLRQISLDSWKYQDSLFFKLTNSWGVQYTASHNEYCQCIKYSFNTVNVICDGLTQSLSVAIFLNIRGGNFYRISYGKRLHGNFADSYSRFPQNSPDSKVPDLYSICDYFVSDSCSLVQTAKRIRYKNTWCEWLFLILILKMQFYTEVTIK